MKINKSNLPSHPTDFYGCGWGELLGNDCKSAYKGEWMPFEEARKFVKKLKLKNVIEWFSYCKSGNKPKNIPYNPNQIYKNEFKGYGYWLGNGNEKVEFLPFEEAKKLIHKLKLKNAIEWFSYCKSGNKPKNIPSNPDKCYKPNWVSWEYWLGNEKVEFLSFEEARNIIRKLKLKSTKDWRNYCSSGNKSKKIPYNPDRIYKDKFKNYPDWLGNNKTPRYKGEWMAFEEARNIIHKLKLKNAEEWKTYCKSGNKLENIPTHPEVNYKNEFKGYSDWLGNS